MTRMQRTLRSAVEFSGLGLHSGERVQVRALPPPRGQASSFCAPTCPTPPPSRPASPTATRPTGARA